LINGSRLIKDLLESNWTAGNTASRTPIFKEYKDYKRANGFDNSDYILTYNRVGNESPSAIGNVSRNVVNRVVVDLRTNLSDDQANLIEREVKRIIRTNVNYIVPGTMSHSTEGQQVIIEVNTTTPFSNTENSNLFMNYRRIIELTLTSPNEAI